MTARPEEHDKHVDRERGRFSPRQATPKVPTAAVGKARRAPPERHTESSLVRFTRDEWRTVIERARVCGRAPAVYIREAALGAAPKARRVPENAELIRQLAHVGNALVALRSASCETGDEPLAGAVEAALADVMEAVHRVG